MIERIERAGPVGGGAAIIERGLSGPSRRRRRLRRFLDRKARGMCIIAPLRLDIESAQAEQLGVVAPGHFAESALGAVAVAGHLRRLRGEQQRQRIARRQPRRIVGGSARAAQIAGADRDQSARDRQIAFHRAAMPKEQRYLFGRAQDKAHDRPQHHEHEHQRGDGERGHHHRCLDVVAHPGDDDIARPIRDPGKAGRQHRDRQQEQDHPDHRALTVARVRAPCRRRIDVRP